MKYYITQTSANPIARIFAALVAAICLLGAFFFGLVILAVIAVLIALFGLFFWLRAWWLGKQMGRHGAVPLEEGGAAGPNPAWRQPAGRKAGSGSQDFIEAEYTVVSERRD